MIKEKLIIKCEEIEQAAWWKTFAYIREGWKCRPFEIQIDYPFGFRNPFCNVFYRKPRTLRETGTERFLHRQVLGCENSLGSYGMGGPGFFGFSLSKTENYPRECLVLTLWGARDWILFDERSFHDVSDEFISDFLGSELVSIDIKQDYSKFEFLKDSKHYKLEAPGDSDKLFRYGDNLEKRVWDTDEHIGDAWVVSRLANLNV